MHERVWISLTTAVFVTACGPQTYSQAAQNQAADQSAKANVTQAKTLTAKTSQEAVSTPPPTPSGAVPPTPVKVGQYQSQVRTQEEAAAIAKIYPHQWAGRPAATLYLRNIPVLMFVSSSAGEAGIANGTKMGETDEGTSAEVPVSPEAFQAQNQANQPQQDDPVWRASEVAAKINQLNRDSADASTITVTPDARGERYTIEVNGQALVAIDGQTILPDTTRNLADDALQATNRLRRLLGNAPPLAAIPGMPKPATPTSSPSNDISLGPVLYRMTGLASWYGPGFDGNLSANGEIFDQNALTAAHTELPFGTRVRVTNLDNGRSVIVRINDRGPYVGGRIIDLSAAAAEVLGMLDTGVARVSLEILGSQNAVTAP
ncbi:septal ring lytic transglycosylase RlpA family protein [Kamptonema formosum]|uniref:septal ring lytic transglycosylase RlpA family protein n=1 Tax=Kamptonema formosum TaxID=331992 RepID=UPI0004763084|nr:septal ring lytic transglycosylase RlpA family protein [Oscillatoria sp. PCC 10802]